MSLDALSISCSRSPRLENERADFLIQSKLYFEFALWRHEIPHDRLIPVLWSFSVGGAGM